MDESGIQAHFYNAKTNVLQYKTIGSSPFDTTVFGVAQTITEESQNCLIFVQCKSYENIFYIKCIKIKLITVCSDNSYLYTTHLFIY